MKRRAALGIVDLVTRNQRLERLRQARCSRGQRCESFIVNQLLRIIEGEPCRAQCHDVDALRLVGE